MTGSPRNAGILIVESDPTVRASFARALEPLGDVELAPNGLEALRLLGTRKFDVVLLDLDVPLIDGFAILRLRAGRSGPNQGTPIYAVTADLSEQTRQRAMREHAAFVLTKPVSIPTLTTLIGAALHKEVSPDAEGAPAPSGPRDRAGSGGGGLGGARAA